MSCYSNERRAATSLHKNLGSVSAGDLQGHPCGTQNCAESLVAVWLPIIGYKCCQLNMKSTIVILTVNKIFTSQVWTPTNFTFLKGR